MTAPASTGLLARIAALVVVAVLIQISVVSACSGVNGEFVSIG